VPRLIWTPQATSDVQRLYRFLVRKSPSAARRAVEAIRTGVKILAHQPRVGRPVPEMDAAFREWVVGFGRDGYVVLYRLDDGDVVLLAIRHGREAGYDENFGAPASDDE
jgi:plasmid stabilization system protein ParE